MSRVIAVDVGATSYRVIEGIYSGGRLDMKVLARFRHGPVWLDGHYRWNVCEIAENVVKTIQAAAGSGEPVSSVGFDTFGTDFGLLDGDGNLLDLPVAYRDDISDGIYEAYFQEEERLYEEAGGTFATTCTAHILKGMQVQRYSPLDKAEALLFMPDLLAFLMTGNAVNEVTIATTSRLLDLKNRRWNEAFIEELGIPVRIFHRLSESGTAVGRLRKEIAAGIPNLQETEVIAVAGHDTASAVATVPNRAGCSFISSGTWSVKGIVTEHPYIDAKACKYKMCNEGQPWGKNRLLRNITGMWLLEECVRSWKAEGKKIEIPQMVSLAFEKPEFPAVIYTDAPDFAKAGNMPEKIKEFCRRTRQPVPWTPVDIVQTIVRGLACEYRRHNEQLEQVTGEKITDIYIMGGGRNNRYLNQRTADVTGCRVTAGHPEATAMGNLLVQLWAHGDVLKTEQFPEIAGRDMPEEIFRPQNDYERETLYRGYLDMIAEYFEK
ncbi:MAG TPA: rhamnulokinase [Candidatus Choladousia intestinipullorum]|nr:rhamnulokinase [Candidatus Choladousia intestinipullorum]